MQTVKNNISSNGIMNTQIKLYKSFITSVKFTEKINVKILQALLDSDLLLETYSNEGGSYVEAIMLKKIMSLTKNGVLNIKYKHSKNGVAKFGRVSPLDGVSLGNLRREIRGTLTDGTYIDIDIVNAHPNMINQLLEKYNLSNTSYNSYCNNRDVTLKKIMNHHSVNRYYAKILFHCIAYGGSYDKWILTSGAVNDKLKMVTDFKKEANALCLNLRMNNQKLYNDFLKKRDKDYNNELAFLAVCLQNYERIILEHTFNFFIQEKLITKNNCILCHDGIMLMQDSITQSKLDELSVYIKSETGFNLQYIEKPLDNFLDKIKIQTLDETKLNKFDVSYLEELPSYDLKKEYFEYFCCKVANPSSCYIFLQTFEDELGTTYKHILKDEKDLKTAWKHLNYDNYGTSDKGGNPKKFINFWVLDPDMRMYLKMDFMPYNDVKRKNDKEVYNLFSGYNSNIKAHTYDDVKINNILKPFFDVVKGLCEDNETYFNYFMKSIAFKVQYPTIKLPYAFIITGKQGTGKGLLMKGLSKVFGSQHVISSSKSSDFCGDHAEGVVNKLIVNMNECENKSTWDFQGFIKSLISEDRVTVNPKFMRPYEVDNHSMFIFTSNKDDVINIDAKSIDRRFIAYKASDKYINKTKYTTKNFWSKLAALIDSVDFSCAFYSYLNNMDVINYDFATERLKCLTETYKQMIRKSIPAASQFLDYFVNKDKFESEDIDDDEFCSEVVDVINPVYNKKVSMPRYELYKEFKKWSDKNRPNSSKQSGYKQSNTAFYSTIRELEFPITFKRVRGRDDIFYVAEEINKHLIVRGWVDDELEGSNDTLVFSPDDAFDDLFSY